MRIQTRIHIYSIIIIGLIFSSGLGCHKKQNESMQPKTLDQALDGLRASLVSASPEVQSNFYKTVNYGLRYGDYAKAEGGLQQLASDPSLTAEQKQSVSEVDDLLKAAMQKQQSDSTN
jgi:hypothetical protein